jgi:hypothetical protein
MFADYSTAKPRSPCVDTFISFPLTTGPDCTSVLVLVAVLQYPIYCVAQSVTCMACPHGLRDTRASTCQAKFQSPGRLLSRRSPTASAVVGRTVGSSLRVPPPRWVHAVQLQPESRSAAPGACVPLWAVSVRGNVVLASHCQIMRVQTSCMKPWQLHRRHADGRWLSSSLL